MDVCFLSDTNAWGGAETHTVALADALVGRGHTVSIVALGDDVYRRKLGMAPRPGIVLRKPPLTKPIYRMGYRECAALVKTLPGDVCVLVRLGVEAGSLRLDLAARRRFGRYIAIEHTSAEMGPRTSRRHLFGLMPGLSLWWYRIRLLWQWRSRVSSRVVCVSEAAREQMVRTIGVPRRKVVAVRNGIDAERYRPDPETRAAVRRSWGVPDDALVFGAVCRHSPEKGLDTAVAQFARLAAMRPEQNLRLVLAGDGPERDSLRLAARDAGLEGRILFPGFTDRPWEAHCGLDVYLQPSRAEAIGLALMEAMACEHPAIATGVGGVPEVLSEPGLGWLTPPGDADAFLAAMNEAASLAPEQRREMGGKARRHVVARFNASRQYEALAKIIEQG